MLGRAGERGQERRKADAAKGVCTWRNPPDVQKWMDDEQSKAAQQRERAEAEGEPGSRSIFKEEVGR